MLTASLMIPKVLFHSRFKCKEKQQKRLLFRFAFMILLEISYSVFMILPQVYIQTKCHDIDVVTLYKCTAVVNTGAKSM